MSKKLILKMCNEVVNGRDFYRYGFDCEGINCCECPFERREEDGNLGCHDRTSEETIKIAKKYIAENTEEEKKEENKFKVGDRVKKVDNRTFSNGDYVVTVKEVDGCKVWFKETGSFLTDKRIKLAEETTKKLNTELTFKEFVNEAEEGKIYVSESGVEFYKDCSNIIIDLTAEVQRIIIPDDAILTLRKQEYTFTEAFAAYEEGKEIESCVSGREWGLKILSFDTFTIEEIRGKWYINN